MNLKNIFLSSLLLASSSTLAAAKFDENVTVSFATVQDGIGEMIQGDLATGDDDGRRLSILPLSYTWRRLANMYKSGHSNVCDKCRREDTCDSENGYTAELLEGWLKDKYGYQCGCSTISSKAIGDPGYRRTCKNCYKGCDCKCECTSYCDYQLECSCL